MFASLIGGHGFYGIAPVVPFTWGGYYEEGTLIWHSRWVTTDAIVECREALACPARGNGAVLMRRIVAVTGDAVVRAVLDPRYEYGAAADDDVHRRDGTWTLAAGDLHVRWTGAPEAKSVDRGTEPRPWRP